MDEQATGGSGDPVERIEAALAALRGGGRVRWGGPHGGGPDGAGGPHRGRAHRGQGDGEHGPHHGEPHGGPWGGRSHGPADDRDGAGDPWRGGRGRRGARGPWEFRVGPIARARLLATLDAADRPMSVTELAGAVGVDQPRASRLVQAAAEDGLVVREADPGDARRTRIRLTDAGRDALRSAATSRRQTIEAALDGFTDGERAQLADLLTRFADGLHRAHR
ncbi:MarR family winged helix-turn-helix transcriptional regulator [Agromyces sp. SYSU T0242]|uniref:MarR family winged helix-turn-helix transcriptional regulator n=1 Tax=Agromyces litoreus TaxID=3158561 RepID=UPI0033972920